MMKSEEQLERKAEADAMPLDSAIGNLKGLADGTIQWGDSIPSECATASVDVVLAQLAEVTRQLEELAEAYQEARDAILNERYGMAEAGFTSDQINDVLGVLDDAFAARIQSAQPKGEWIEVDPDNLEAEGKLPDYAKDAYWRVAWSYNGRIRCEWSRCGATLWREVPPRKGYKPVAYYSIPHIDRRPDIPDYQAKEQRDEQ